MNPSDAIPLVLLAALGTLAADPPEKALPLDGEVFGVSGRIAGQGTRAGACSIKWHQLADDWVDYWFGFFTARTPPRLIAADEIAG